MTQLQARQALPFVPPASEIRGPDTRAQARENTRRMQVYTEMLRTSALPLPAVTQQPYRLSIEDVGREAGVSVGILRAGKPARALLDGLKAELGLAVIFHNNEDRTSLSVQDVKERLMHRAPVHAEEWGIKRSAVEKCISEIFDLMMRRSAQNRAKLALPIIESLQQDLKAAELTITPRAAGILENIQDWLSDPDDAQPSLSTLDFQGLLGYVLSKTGLSEAALARLAGVTQSTMWKWLHEERDPNARSYGGLRIIALQAGLPSESLIQSISRKKTGSEVRMHLADFPDRFRTKQFQGLRASVKLHLTEEDFHLEHQDFLARIELLCLTLDAPRAIHRKRKAMRDANATDRSGFSDKLRQELEAISVHLTDKGRSGKTVKTYFRFIEGFFGFALSDAAPPELRLTGAVASVAHLASAPLWDAYFTHLIRIGREEMAPEFKICRAMVERIKFVISLFNAEDGFFRKSKSLVAALGELPDCHLGLPEGVLQPRFLFSLIKEELSELKQRFMRLAAPVEHGRDQIADLLAMDDPTVAVKQMIRHQRAIVMGLKKYRSLKANSEQSFDSGQQINRHYAVALRRLIVLHLLLQTALRVGMLPEITFGTEYGCHLTWEVGKKPHLHIPAALFKNRDTGVFKSDDYKRDLLDIEGCYADLQLYFEEGRPCLLNDQESKILFPVDGPDKKINSLHIRQDLAKISRAAIGADAPEGERLMKADYLRPHHFRDILATYVLHNTNKNYALAGDAIHVTEETAREYYAHDTAEMRRPELDAVLAKMADQTADDTQESPLGD